MGKLPSGNRTVSQSNYLASSTDDALYRLLVDGVTDYAIYMLDQEGFVASWSASAQLLKGYTKAEILGQHFSQFYIEEDQEADVPARALETSAREGRAESEGWRLRKDGSCFWAHAVIYPVRGPDGGLIGYAKIVRDFSDRKYAEGVLRGTEAQFSRLVDGVTDYAIYRLTTDGIVTSWNMGAQRMKGYRANEIIGHPFSCFYTEEDQADDLPRHALDTALRDGKFEIDTLQVKKDGSRFHANIVIDPIFDEDGDHIGFAKITRDITKANEFQKSLEESRETLFQAQKMDAVGQFSGGLANDFNNILTGISGNLELMQTRIAQGRIGEIDRYIAAAQSDAKRAAELTSRLLTFSRNQTLNPKPTNVNQLILRMDQLIKRTMGGKISVDIVAAPDLWTTMVDQGQLENGLLDLCVNARDAMQNGGALRIETCNQWVHGAASGRNLPAGEYVAIRVIDNGTGMTPEVMRRAFEPLFTTKAKGMGTGLGLSMMYGFATQSGGQLHLYSEPGHGSTVCLYLPRRQGAEGVAEPPAPLDPGSRFGHGRTVLIVDDEETVRKLVVDGLQDHGYASIVAEDAFTGFKILQSNPDVDILISDVGLPGGMNGLQLAAAAKAIRPTLKVLFITGYAESALVNKGPLDPGIRVLTKPFSLHNLSSTIRDILSVSG